MNHLQSVERVEHASWKFAVAQPQASGWQAFAIAAYQQSQGDLALRMALAQRLRELTGQSLPLASIYADSAERLASATLDGVRFRLEHGQLALLRSCAHCGQGALASPALHSPADLGYALSDWQPHHAACAAEDSASWGE